MSPGATFERVYVALKERIRCGAFRPGEHIEPASLGEELASSMTPVRDALHRLAGERLVEAPRADGFRAPLLTELGLRHLYGWNLDLLLLALRSARPPPYSDQTMLPSIEGTDAPEGIAETTGSLFLEIARRSANPEHAAAISNVNDRLHPLRLIEPERLPDTHDDLAGIVRLLRSEEIQPLRRAITSYHRRRHRAAPFLLEALHSRAAEPGRQM